MKMVLRIMVSVIWNLITLPFQLISIAVVLLTKFTEEEEKWFNEFINEMYTGSIRWIKTGRADEPEDKEP